MKHLPLFALLAPALLTASLSAQAAMSQDTRATFIKECVSTAGQNLDAKAAQTHCACGADQVNKNFNDKEIAELNNTSTPPPVELTTRLQKVVAEHCVAKKQ
jgi:uncharacterized low-complexity protein